ncbi:MAG: outer membrane lipoprotein carrier protein LolA [Proteobacteria bacterium]|nr:outer membrane lipoprotein carrier protein LolA [Pseudomonadota bacterium]
MTTHKILRKSACFAFVGFVLCSASALAQTPDALAPNIAQPANEYIAQAIKNNENVKPKGSVSDDARQYVDAIQAYYDRAKTYSASFEQDYETVDGVKKKSSGVVWFKKPGMMRWDYEKPESRFLISDGKFMWSWEPVYRQYCKQSLAGSQLPTALSFLSGTGKIEDDFSVKLGKVKDNQVTIELTPVVPSMAFEKIKFEILMPTGKVYRAQIFDAMGNVNRITFKSPEINAELQDSSFLFNPPADAKHICE